MADQTNTDTVTPEDLQKQIKTLEEERDFFKADLKKAIDKRDKFSVRIKELETTSDDLVKTGEIKVKYEEAQKLLSDRDVELENLRSEYDSLKNKIKEAEEQEKKNLLAQISDEVLRKSWEPESLDVIRKLVQTKDKLTVAHVDDGHAARAHVNGSEKFDDFKPKELAKMQDEEPERYRKLFAAKMLTKGIQIKTY